MRIVSSHLLGLLVLAACAGPAPPPAPAPTEAWVPAEVAHLRAALATEVPQHTGCGTEPDRSWIAPAQAAVTSAGVVIDRPQLIVAVDRSPARQRLCLLLARAHAPWETIGGSRVSTGQSGRNGYFITPTGVFVHSTAIIDYRAEGTFNENGIRGLGTKGMRVWDFGWQRAAKGWPADEATGEIRLLLHATDPDQLEQRLGRPASKGCIRIPAAMNRFLDHHGVLDAAYEHAAASDAQVRAVLAPDRDPTPLAGDALVIIDSSARP